MSNILVLTGSARPNSASSKVAEQVSAAIARHDGAEGTIVEVATLQLPFFNAPTAPSADDYEITDPNVQAWSDMVQAADAVVWVLPEYNHSMSGIQKNAIDWLYSEWKDKPLMMVGYGWYEGAHTLAAAKHVCDVVKPAIRAEVGLGFMKQLNVDGSAKEQAEVDQALDAAVAKLLA